MSRQQKKQQYDISEDELKQIQTIQQELLREVARICLKCGIHFNMVGGTMLGAIRHKGYIPWDDDADIGFLRTKTFRIAPSRNIIVDDYTIIAGDCIVDFFSIFIRE